MPMSFVCTIDTTTSPPTGHYVEDGKLTLLPFRQGARIMHDASHLGLPAFVVFDDQVFDLLASSFLTNNYSMQMALGQRHKTRAS